MSLAGKAHQPCLGGPSVPWLNFTPASGSLPADASEPVTVTFNSIGLDAGIAKSAICAASSDPMKPFLAIPVTLAVGDRIFGNGFD